MIYSGLIEEEFGVKPIMYGKTEYLANECMRAYAGYPDWVREEEDVETINMARAICAEIARLVMIGTSIKIDGARGKYLQDIVDKNYPNFRKWVERMAACGTMVLKPNGDTIDAVMPGEYAVTEEYNGEIWGAVFQTTASSANGKEWFLRHEYHRFEGEGDEKTYMVTNVCYKANTSGGKTERVAIEETPWAKLTEEVSIRDVERPLFAVLRTPFANYLDMDAIVSPPAFATALTELKDLDIAYSRNAREIEQSTRTVMIDSDRLLVGGASSKSRFDEMDSARQTLHLPSVVKGVEGAGDGNFYTEINPSLNTQTRIAGINALLSQIGYKIGFANGYFVFDQKTGIQTATGVEADQQRTVQLVKDFRDQVEKCINDLIYAIDIFATLYNLAPSGKYKAVLDFGDLIYNREEDKAHWMQYVQMGKVPFWYFLTKFEGMTEQEAKSLEEQAQAETLQSLFAQQQMAAE